MEIKKLRTGIGHDTHLLADGGPLRLGGIEIPFNRHLVGHSDADVLLHAITDAILGASALGDIGEMFPNTDQANRDRDSRDMLKLAMRLARQNHFHLINLDCIVFAQRPKLIPFRKQIADSISQVLDVESELIGIKAKTGEGVGEVGNEQCIQAQCVALLFRDD